MPLRAALGPTRMLVMPEWMAVKASGTAAGAHETLPLVASGALPAGRFGVVAFDVRGHLLLDPDRLDALVATVDLVRELTRAGGTADCRDRNLSRDAGAGRREDHRARWRRDIGVARPMGPPAPPSLAARAITRSKLPAGKTDVYANYYDASESDLIAIAAPSAPALKSASAAESAAAPIQVQPLSALLIIFAVIAIVLESALLLRTANRWGMRHV